MKTNQELVEVYTQVTQVEGRWRTSWRYRGMNWDWSRSGNGSPRSWASKKAAINYITKAWPEAKFIS